MRSPEFLATLNQSTGVASEWADRVVANGGARPAASTITAMENFRQGLSSAGLLSKMLSVCVFVPDNLIAATTPLIVGIGADPWTNHNFVDADLTVDGLKGNASNKYLDTGVIANAGNAYNSITHNSGISVVISEVDGNGNSIEVGHRDTSNNILALASSSLYNSVTGRSIYWCRTSAAVIDLYVTDWNRCGYLSGNNLGGTTTLYAATPLVAHKTLGSAAVTPIPSISATETLFAFAFNDHGTAGQLASKRLSFCAIHDALTLAESTTFSNLILTLRTALGGGTGDEIENWAARVVSNGGTAPSTSTKNAFRTFFNGLVSNSLLDKTVSLNCVAPDNLTAARKPLIWNAGNEFWTNHNFVDADLTVNGLFSTGNPRYLSTGIYNSTAQILTDDSGGWSVLHNNVASSQCVGGTTGASSTHFTLVAPESSGNAILYCWGFSGASGVNWLQVALSPSASSGFLSGSRTASNAIALYAASEGYPFTTIGTGAGARTQTRFNGEALAFAASQDASSTPGAYLVGTMSFIACHAGLNATETENLFNLAVALRTALGGGYLLLRATDDLEGYANGAALDGLDGGSNWSDAYVARYSQGLATDDLESYTDGAALDGLNGGTNWSDAYVARYSQGLATDDIESYTDGAALSGLNGGTNWSDAYTSR